MPLKTPTKPKSKWNIMVYIVGDRSLSGSMISQLKELTDAGFQKDTTVLAFFDPNCNGKRARIFDVNRRRKQEKMKSDGTETIIGDGKDPFVRDIAEDYHIPSLPHLPAAITLRYFLEYSRTYYPAENYILFLMGHGVIVGNDTFLPDPDDPTGGINLADLGWILKNFGEKVKADDGVFQLIGFHSCSMNSIELVHDLAGSARYMMGTQGSANPGSWPYRQILKKIFGVIEDTRNEDANAVLVEEILPSLQSLSFYNSEDYWLAGYSADLAICSLDPNRVNKLQLRIGQLSRALKAGLKDRATKEAIQLAHLRSQSYWAENYTDLYDFCSCLLEHCREKSACQFAIRNACEDVQSALHSPEGSLVVYSDFYGPAYQFSYGISIFFPWKSPVESIRRTYANYNFTRNYKEDSWWSFLENYFVETQRQPRKKDGRVAREGPERPAEIILIRSQLGGLLRRMSAEQILALSPYGPYGSFETNGKSSSLRATEVEKTGLEPPDKVLEPPDKVLEPPDKVLEPPDKVLGFWENVLEPPDKVLEPPDKVLDFWEKVLEPPDKVPGLGLFGLSVVKNFYAPDNVFLTSRPQGFNSWKGQQPAKSNRGDKPKYRRD